MITDEDVAIIKGMLARDDKQQWIVAWFGGDFNPGRIAEINTGQKHLEINAAPMQMLPPVGPYVSGRSANRALIALQTIRDEIDRAIGNLSLPADNADETPPA